MATTFIFMWTVFATFQNKLTIRLRQGKGEKGEGRKGGGLATGHPWGGGGGLLNLFKKLVALTAMSSKLTERLRSYNFFFIFYFWVLTKTSLYVCMYVSR